MKLVHPGNRGKHRNNWRNEIKRIGKLFLPAVALLSIGLFSQVARAQQPTTNPKKNEEVYDGYKSKDKKIKLPLETGYNITSNEGGSSFSADISYPATNSYLTGSIGAIYFFGNPHPFVNISANPNFKLWKKYIQMGYIGNVALSIPPKINSWVYSSHGIYLSSEIEVSEKLRINLSSLLQGALSYPSYDDIYVKWTMFGINLTMEKNFQWYLLLNSYFAASKTSTTTWALDYAPRYEGIEAGFSWEYEKSLTMKVYFDMDVIQPVAAFSISRLLFSNNGWEIIVNGATGITSFNSDFFSKPAFFANASVIIKVDDRKNPNTMLSGTVHRFSYENRGMGNSQKSKIWKSSSKEKKYMDDAEKNLLNAKSFDELVSMYNGKDITELLAAANRFGKILGQVGYEYKAFDLLNSLKLFDPVLKKMTHRNYEDVFGYLKQYAQYKDEHGNYKGLPNDLKDGVAICGGIHDFMAEFLRENGVNAYTVSVNTSETAHMVTFLQYGGKGYILDYGGRLISDSGSLSSVLRAYSKAMGVPIFQTQIFGAGSKPVGMFETPEGRLLHQIFRVGTRENNLRVLKIR